MKKPSEKTQIIAILVIIIAFVLSMSFSSCSVLKKKNRYETKVDSTVNTQTETNTTTHEVTGIDTTFLTGADTLSGFAPDEEDTTVIESDEQTITVTKDKSKKGVNVQAVKKPEKITVQARKEVTTVSNQKQVTKVDVHKKAKTFEKDKKTTTPWYVIVIGAIILFCILAMLYKWLCGVFPWLRRKNKVEEPPQDNYFR